MTSTVAPDFGYALGSMDMFSAVVTLFLIMDPLGNIPVFLSILKQVAPERRRTVLVRELFLAYAVLIVLLLLGNHLLRLLKLDHETIGIAGGVILFLIALRMIFPPAKHSGDDQLEGEPFLVPLAVPLIAGPSTLAALLLLQRTTPGATLSLLAALTIAWALSGVILLSSTFFYRWLGERGLIALERLMGMLLVMVAVQMLMDGLKAFVLR